MVSEPITDAALGELEQAAEAVIKRDGPFWHFSNEDGKPSLAVDWLNAADPSAVLALVERVRRAEKERDDWQKIAIHSDGLLMEVFDCCEPDKVRLAARLMNSQITAAERNAIAIADERQIAWDNLARERQAGERMRGLLAEVGEHGGITDDEFGEHCAFCGASVDCVESRDGKIPEHYKDCLVVRLRAALAAAPTPAPEQTLDALQASIGAWGDATFRAAGNPRGPIYHLAGSESQEGEVRELVRAFEAGEDLSEETADIAILAIQIAHRSGFSIREAIERKMAKNRARKWGPPDEHGVCLHAKDAAAPREESER